MSGRGILQGLRHAISALAGDRAGSVLVELGFTIPALMLFVLGVCEAGRVLWLQNALNFSVAEGARCWSNSPTVCGSATAAKSYAANASGAGFASSVFTATSVGCGNQVTASYPVTLSIPYVNVSLTLSSQACYPT